MATSRNDVRFARMTPVANALICAKGAMPVSRGLPLIVVYALYYAILLYVSPSVGYSIYTDLCSYLYKWTHLPMGIYLSIQQFVFAGMRSLCITCSLNKLVAIVITNVIASEDNGRCLFFCRVHSIYCYPKHSNAWWFLKGCVERCLK